MTDKIVVLCTCSGEEEASRIARLLVESRVAACVNVLPGVRSHYRWQEKIESAEEVLLLIKTSRTRFDDLRGIIERAHSYDVPEIVALPIVEGSAAYLDWIAASL